MFYIATEEGKEYTEDHHRRGFNTALESNPSVFDYEGLFNNTIYRLTFLFYFELLRRGLDRDNFHEIVFSDSKLNKKFENSRMIKNKKKKDETTHEIIEEQKQIKNNYIQQITKSNAIKETQKIIVKEPMLKKILIENINEIKKILVYPNILKNFDDILK